jgi:hypothetical protein
MHKDTVRTPQKTQSLPVMDRSVNTRHKRGLMREAYETLCGPNAVLTARPEGTYSYH